MKRNHTGQKWCAFLVTLAIVTTSLPLHVFADVAAPLREREELDETYRPGVFEELEDWEGDKEADETSGVEADWDQPEVRKDWLRDSETGDSPALDPDWSAEVEIPPTITEVNDLGDNLRDDSGHVQHQKLTTSLTEERELTLPVFIADEILEELDTAHLSKEERFVFLEALLQLPDDRQEAGAAAAQALSAYNRIKLGGAEPSDQTTAAAFFQVEEAYLSQALAAGLGLYTTVLDCQHLLSLGYSQAQAQEAVLSATVEELQEEALKWDEPERESAQLQEIEALSASSNDDVMSTGAVEDALTAPFLHTDNAFEQISLSNQNLQYSVQDVALPGKGGMDLVITRQYRSNEAAYYEQYGRLSYQNGRKTGTAQVNYSLWEKRYDINDDDSIGKKRRGSFEMQKFAAPTDSRVMSAISSYRTLIRGKKDNYYAYQEQKHNIERIQQELVRNMTTASVTSKEARWDMGTGWSLGFSYVDYSNKFHDSITLHLSDGRSFTVLDNAFQNGLGMYFYEDLAYGKRGGTLGGVQYATYLNYADGRTEYFDGEGRLVMMRDKHKNSIKFSYAKAGTRQEMTITDSLGQTVKIYNEATKTGFNKIIELPDKQKITYVLQENTSRKINAKKEKHKGEYNEYVLAAVIDQAGQTTHYAYNDVKANAEFHAAYKPNRYGLLTGHPFEEDHYTPNYYAALKQVTYPTGLTTHYEYYQRYNSWGIIGVYEDIAVKARYDKQGSAKYNELKYNFTSQYTHQKKDGSVLYNIGGYHNEEDGVKGLNSWNNHVATVTDVARNTKTRYTFDKEGHCIRTEVVNAADDKVLTATNTKYRVYQFLTQASPISVTATDYRTTNGKAQTATELYEYDNRGNVTAYWSPLAEGNKAKTDYKTSFIYHSRNNMPLSKTYKTDSKTTVVESNLLSRDRRNVEGRTVTVNGVEKSKSLYTYDNSGNVLTSKDYVSFSPEQVIETAFVYDSNAVFPVKKTAKNVKDADGKLTGDVSSTLTYDMYGRVKSVTDGNGHVTRYTHDKAGRVTSIRYPDNKEKKFAYDVGRNYTIATDQRGFQMKYQYDRAGNLNAVYEMPAKKGDPEVKLLTYVYDAVNRLVREENHAFTYGSKTYYTYRQDDLLTQKKVVDNNKKTLYTETNQIYADQVKQTIAGDSAAPSQTTVQYLDKYGRVTRSGVVLGREELLDTYSYNYVGQPLTVKHRRANKEKYKESFTGKMEYDHTGQVVKATNVLNETATKGYDALGREVWSVDPKNNAERTNQKTVVTYDQMGRVIQKKTPFEKGAYATEKYYYDKNGNLVRTLVSNNLPGQAASFARTDYAYNKKNELVKVVSYDQGAAANTVSYEYDAAGNMTAMTTGNGTQKTVYSYDRFHRVAAITDPQGMTESYTYDKNGYLTAKTDRNGVVTRFAYDGLGREVSRTAEVPGKTQTERTGYAATGAVAFVENDTIRLNYTYDQLGRVTTERDNKGTVLSYTYDTGNNMTSLSVSVNGKEVKKAGYVYDKLDRLSQVKNGNTVAATYQYDKNGNRASLTYGNGVNTTYSYNLANLPVTLTNKAGTKTLSSYQYGYQLDGNQRTKTEHNGRKVNYTYDDLGRLVSEAESGAADAITKRYAFDGANNRAAMTVTGAEAYTVGYQYDKNNRLLSTAKKEGSKTSLTEYFYDNNGNQISESTSLTATPMKLLEEGAGEGLVPLPEQKPGLGDGETAEAPEDSENPKNAITPEKAGSEQPKPEADAAQEPAESKPAEQETRPEAEAAGPKPLEPATNAATKESRFTAQAERKEKTQDKAEAVSTAGNTDETVRLEVTMELTRELESAAEAVNARNANHIANIRPTVGAATLAASREAGTLQPVSPVVETQANHSLTETRKPEVKSMKAAPMEALANIETAAAPNPVAEVTEPEARPAGAEGRENSQNRTGLQPELPKDATLSGPEQPQNPPEKSQEDTASENDPTEVSKQDLSDEPTEHPEQAERLKEEAAPLIEPQLTLADDAAQFRTYRYDGFNRLVKTESGGQSAVYNYRPDGLRYSKTIGTDTRIHIWEGSKIGLELDGAGNVVDVYLNGMSLIQSNANGYYIYNGHGDVVQLTNGSGQVTKEYTYDAFGNERKPDAADANPFRYCGEYFDKETGSIYLRARYYDPGTGRFSQRDSVLYVNRDVPNGQNIIDPLSLNLYTYCINNPVRFHDPSGHFYEIVLDVASAVANGYQFITAPSLGGFILTAWDVVAIVIPVVPGSYVYTVGKLVLPSGAGKNEIKEFRKLPRQERYDALIGGQVIAPYKDLKKMADGLSSMDAEVHHLIEKRFAARLGMKENAILSVLLDDAVHDKVTLAMRKEIGYKGEKANAIRTDTATPQQIWNAMKKVYTNLGMAEYLEPIKQQLKDNGHYLNW